MAVATGNVGFQQSCSSVDFKFMIGRKTKKYFILHRRASVRIFASLSVQQTPVIDHSSFIRDIAGLDPPNNLDALLKILEAKGETLVTPENRNGIIPLAIPLSRSTATGEYTALLRWPTPPQGMEVPLVRVNGNGVQLLSKSIESYIHRSLCEEEAAGGDGSLAAAAGKYGRQIYAPGTFEASGITKLDVFLSRKVALFPDVMERLALSHLEKGDEVSALITGDFYTRNHFPGFGRPFVFNSMLLSRVNRTLESVDAAKSALKSPWWTLGAPYSEVAEVAGHADTYLELVKERLSDLGKEEDLVKGKAPAQVALDQAAFLLDLSSAELSWNENRTRLASLYCEGGLPEFANFILSGM